LHLTQAARARTGAIGSLANPHPKPVRLIGQLIGALSAVWLLTAASALITATVPLIGRLARHTLDLPLRPASPPTPWRMADIAIANTFVMSVPLLLRVVQGEQPGRALRRCSATVLCPWLAENVTPVGAAIGSVRNRRWTGRGPTEIASGDIGAAASRGADARAGWPSQRPSSHSRRALTCRLRHELSDQARATRSGHSVKGRERLELVLRIENSVRSARALRARGRDLLGLGDHAPHLVRVEGA
jgi:hypothetical protein